jgi:hypothetical protein
MSAARWHSVEGRGAIRLAVAPLIGGYDTISRVRARFDLVTPGIAQFRESMAEDYKRSRSLFQGMHTDAIGFDEDTFEVGQESPRLRL